MESSVGGLARAVLLILLSENGLLISLITFISTSPPFQLTGERPLQKKVSAVSLLYVKIVLHA